MRARYLCLWCGNYFPSETVSSYCTKSHKRKAEQRRSERKQREDRQCIYPHTQSWEDRGPAVKQGPVIDPACPCGRYHLAADILKEMER